MSKSGACDILRRIVPWALESNAIKLEHRCNYKGVRGRIGVVGGARDYAGAPYFASISAMRLGADLAYVICSRSAGQVIKGYSPDLIVTPLLDCENEVEFILEMDCLLDRLHALVIGPGLGREELVQTRAKMLIKEAKIRSLPLVLDADSLSLVNDDPSLIRSYPKALLTPNRVELQRMLNTLYAPKTFDLRNLNTQDIKELVRQCSKELDVTILAKGIVDIISSPKPSEILLVQGENSGSNRRCGGQGDVLSGLAGTYLHWMEQATKDQNGEKIQHPIAWAAYLASMTTRQCNELAFKDQRNGMLVSDMIGKISAAFDLLLNNSNQSDINDGKTSIKNCKYSMSLSRDEIMRYTRQMIMEEFGPERQMQLRKASAIIIGAGGLGCPAAIYLGAGGIGRLGIVDDDKVEASNLHRQILHNLDKVGLLKTESIKQAILAINPNVQVDTHSVKMTRHNAVQLIEDYNIVIDATDNLLTRYMISDACVVAKKPLVSGAALKMDGQLTVYNYDEDTPCFRCLFPEPPPLAAVGSCSDNGVLGVIPGVIGVHQALEAMKIGAGLRPAYAGKMLLYDGQLGLFRHIKLGQKKEDCQACGSGSVLGRDLIDYEVFCGQATCQTQAVSQESEILKAGERISLEQYKDILESNEPHVLVDVRPSAQSEVAKFAHALCIPLQELVQEPGRSLRRIRQEVEVRKATAIYVVCRRGIASQKGAKIIQDLFEKDLSKIAVKDIVGGMTGWAKHIDPSFTCL